jgi:hypothetical protein
LLSVEPVQAITIFLKIPTLTPTPTPTIKFKIPPLKFFPPGSVTSAVTPTVILTSEPTEIVQPTGTVMPEEEVTGGGTLPTVPPSVTPMPTPTPTRIGVKEAAFISLISLLILIIIFQSQWPKIKNWLHKKTE